MVKTTYPEVVVLDKYQLETPVVLTVPHNLLTMPGLPGVVALHDEEKRESGPPAAALACTPRAKQAWRSCCSRAALADPLVGQKRVLLLQMYPFQA